ncbi:MAG: hypothetical protein JSV19_06780 [Phycisphaerales bacterium]|nr:MAG: hypothetical protein JSV19_06780 [Phycisphaerales bacterium]
MSLGSDEIERMMGDVVTGWGINTSLYCGTCGYNLRGLPYSGLCPECGHPYNARDHNLVGIFLPQRLELPISDVFASLVSLGLAVFLALYGLREPSLFLLAALFGLFAVLFLRLTWRRVAQYIRWRRILWRIESEE